MEEEMQKMKYEKEKAEKELAQAKAELRRVKGENGIEEEKEEKGEKRDPNLDWKIADMDAAIKEVCKKKKKKK